MQYELMHLSAIPRPEDLFNRRQTLPSREEWLRKIFSRPQVFEHRGAVFHFRPTGGVHDTILAGRIGKPTKVVESAPPEENLSEVERSAWAAATVLIDPRHHDQGQKVAMEQLGTVGKPFPIFESLVVAINASTTEQPEPYVLQVGNIAEEQTFWSFVAQHKGEITSVSFELIPPNMFGLTTDLDAEMQAIKTESNPIRVRFGMDNPDGLNPDTPRVHQTANYAARGGGKIKASTKSGKKFNSTTKSKRIRVGVTRRHDQPKETVVQRFRRAIKTIFGL